MRYYNHHGIATPDIQMPRTGNATYNGIISGFGTVTAGSGSVTDYNLAGTGTLTASFGSSSFVSDLAINGRSTDTNTLRDFGSFNFTGNILGSRFNAGINGRSLAGQFYGPGATELAALFNIVVSAPPVPTPSDRVELNGLFLGKKAP